MSSGARKRANTADERYITANIPAFLDGGRQGPRYGGGFFVLAGGWAAPARPAGIVAAPARRIMRLDGIVSGPTDPAPDEPNPPAMRMGFARTRRYHRRIV